MPNTTEPQPKQNDHSTDKPLDLSHLKFRSFPPSEKPTSETTASSTAQTNTAQTKAPENPGSEATRNGL
jgi:hypothetical protein